MKRIFLLLAFAGTIAAANAQTKFGVKGGLNVNNVGGADVNNNKARIGFHLGAFAEMDIAERFSVQPELLYSAQGVKWEAPGEDAKTNLGYLNIPVMLKYQIVDGFYGQAGPQFGFLLSAKRKYDGSSINIKEEVKTFDFALGLGAGYKFPSSPFGIDARYNIGLSRLYEDGDAKAFNRVLQVGVFYVLGQGK